MLLERLDGKPVTKILKQPYFHDCQFVYDMLCSVFNTLETAQGAFGFHHADFRLANVWATSDPSSRQGQRTVAACLDCRFVVERISVACSLVLLCVYIFASNSLCSIKCMCEGCGSHYMARLADVETHHLQLLHLSGLGMCD